MTTAKFVSTLVSVKSLQKEFADHVDDLKRRIERIQAAQRGDLGVKRITIKSYKVPAYRVGEHVRIILTKRPAKVATVRKAA